MTERGRWLAVFAGVAGVEVRRWARQPLAVASTLLLPVALAALVTVALDNAGRATRAEIGVVDLDGGPAARSFLADALGHPSVADVVDVVALASTREAAGQLDAGDVDAVVVLPAGLSAGLAAPDGGAAPAIDVWTGDDDLDPLADDLAVLVVNEFTIRARATAVASAQGGREPDLWPLEVTVTAPDGAPLDAARHFGPATGLFFVLVAQGSAAQRLAFDRGRGIVDRLASAPVSPSAVLAGRGAAAVATGCVSLGVTAATMQLLFGRSWGPLVPVALLIAAVAVALAGVAALLAAVARTPEQATSLAAAVAFVFAIASGSFVPPGSIGRRPRLAELVPTTHALDGFALLATERAGVAEVAPSLAWLLAFGACGLAATAALRRRLA